MIKQFIHILLIEDHPLYREALVNELSQQLPAVRFLQAGTITEAFDHIQTNDNIKLTILDLNLPDSDGLKSLLAIHQLIPHVPIAVISAAVDSDTKNSTLQFGAAAFIEKTSNTLEIRNALAHLIDFDFIEPAKATHIDALSISAPPPPVILSVRQQQVLLQLAKGLSNKEIATNMGLAETTVRDHVTEILRRLEASNRTHAVVRAQKIGLID